MFGNRNVGDRIRLFADVIVWINLLAAAIGAYFYVYNTRFRVLSIIIGVLFIIVVAILSWLGSSVLYGFAQNVDNADRLADSSDRIADSLENLASSQTSEQINEYINQDNIQRYPPQQY